MPELLLSTQEGATDQRNTHGIFAQAAATASLNHPMQRVVLVVPGTMAGTKVVIRFSQVRRNYIKGIPSTRYKIHKALLRDDGGLHNPLIRPHFLGGVGMGGILT